jgi:hypothetical protein
MSTAVETLMEKRNTLLTERANMNHKYDAEIKELEKSIELLSGKKMSELEPEFRYDDENPDYIKGTEDGI